MNFVTKFAQKRWKTVKNWKNKSHHWILHIRISLDPKFQLKLTILIFGPNLLKNGISKNQNFLCVHGRYLLYYTFPHGGRQTQQYFNVSCPSRVTETIRFDILKKRESLLFFHQSNNWTAWQKITETPLKGTL